MVFSSVPLYLDPPNWQQQTNQQLQGSIPGAVANENQHLFSPVGAQPPTPAGMGGGGGGSAPTIRPNSMTERARMAKIPPPETPLKCPRCDSTNTKFCYFNNYSLTQPRHFCKTCRRYWTRGGALRNVPVGGGCRRNKRSSGTKSSSAASGGSATSAASKSSSLSTGDHLSGGIPPPPSFMASLQNIAAMGNLGLNFGGSLQHALGGLVSTPPQHHHQLDQFNVSHSSLLNHHQSFLGGFEMPAGSGAPVKMEDGPSGLGLGPANQLWAGNIVNNTNNNMWADVSGLNSSSITHLL